MKVLFVDPSTEYLARRPCELKLMPPLGMTYVASYAQARGHRVRALDLLISRRTGETLEAVLADFRPDLAAFSCTIPFLPATYRAAGAVKQVLPDATLVLGGNACTALRERCFEECAELDYLVIGEGELSFLGLAEELEGSGRPDEVPGVLSRARGRPAPGGRALVEDLDVLPFPDWSLYPLEHYDTAYSIRLDKQVHVLPISFSRGCIFHCPFCSSAFGASYRTRSAENTVREIEEAYERFGVEFFDFLDPTATSDGQRFAGLCKALARSPVRDSIAWTFETRADRVDRDLLGLAREAGCESVLYGIESGSQAILDSLGKGITRQQCWRALEETGRAGLHIKCSLILGTPGETPETLRETLDFVTEACREFGVEFLPAFLGIYPGTKFHELVDEGRGGVSWKPGVRGNWAKARRETPMINIPNLSDDDLVECRTAIREASRAHRPERRRQLE